MVDHISTIGFSAEHKAADVLGEVYEYFLGMFAAAEGKRGGQYYTTKSIVKTLVAVLSPTKGRIYDPCCGSGGMFVQSEQFVEAHGGKRDDISIYGQESNATTWRLAAMNLALRGYSADLGKNMLALSQRISILILSSITSWQTLPLMILIGKVKNTEKM